jgi:small GTP-binding protein
MIQKKICLLGAFAVGKTSLIARFVHSIFSGKYHTTIGVKIDKKRVNLPGKEIELLIWDLAGEDEFNRVEETYLLGSSGYLLVVDGTRQRTLEQAIALQQRAQATMGAVPFLLLLNKADRAPDWDLDKAALSDLAARGWTLLRTSALTGDGVDDAFAELTRRMVAP